MCLLFKCTKKQFDSFYLSVLKYWDEKRESCRSIREHGFIKQGFKH